MNLKKIKRFLALLKAEAEHDRNHGINYPIKFKESFEKQKHFRGWINYKVTWYIDENDPWKIIPINRELYEGDTYSDLKPYIDESTINKIDNKETKFIDIDQTEEELHLQLRNEKKMMRKLTFK